MKVLTELDKNPNLSIALGFFDGVHLGHQAVIKSAVNYAKQNGTKSAVITFKDHPCCYLWNLKPKYILPQKIREKKIKELGIDYLYELDFESISGLTAEDYIRDVLVKYFSPCAISTGWNHNFGYKKSGNVKFLKENSKKYGYCYFELSPEKYNNEIISSTAIRKYLQSGKIEKANSMLGYKFSISGEIVKGNQIGRTIGFNTANIKYPEELIEIPFGAYSVDTNYGKGIANYGIRPTVNGSLPILEVHILDFDQNIYGEKIQVEFIKMLRPERKFKSLEELKKQIEKDILSI